MTAGAEMGGEFSPPQSEKSNIISIFEGSAPGLIDISFHLSSYTSQSFRFMMFFALKFCIRLVHTVILIHNSDWLDRVRVEC